jgi:hypothetical protein
MNSAMGLKADLKADGDAEIINSALLVSNPSYQAKQSKANRQLFKNNVRTMYEFVRLERSLRTCNL